MRSFTSLISKVNNATSTIHIFSPLNNVSSQKGTISTLNDHFARGGLRRVPTEDQYRFSRVELL